MIGGWDEGTLARFIEDRVEARLQQASSGLATLAPGPVVTSLPTSPVDGQVIDYLADATNGILWTLKYVAAASGAYKWLYRGGSVMAHDLQATAGETTASTTYTELTTTGPTLTAPLAGDYMIGYGCQYFTDTAFAGNFSSLWLGTSSVVANSSCGGTPDVANEVATAFRQRLLTGVSAAQEIRMRYLVTAGTGNFSKRAMTMVPVRVG